MYKRQTWGLLAIFSAVPFSETIKLLELLPNVVTADCLALGLFVSHAWRWPIFRKWLVPFPDLNGTWQGTIQTTWVNPQTGERPGPIPVALVIRQSFVSVDCIMRTGEMTSQSYSADFVLDNSANLCKLVYSYRSNPRPTVAERSQPHEGTIVFEVVGDTPKKLKGEYWTARKTTGEVVLTLKSRKHQDDIPAKLPPHPVSGAGQ